MKAIVWSVSWCSVTGPDDPAAGADPSRTRESREGRHGCSRELPPAIINYTYLHRADHGHENHQHHRRGIRAAEGAEKK